MKKVLALLLAGLLCFSICACGTEKQQDTWSIKQTVDEFGDVTENSAEVITGVFEGTFSNTATAESDLTVVVAIGKKTLFNHYLISFDLKEYNNTKATYLSSDTKLFKTKINEEIITMDLDGTEPNGTLYLGSQDYSYNGDIIFNELFKGNDVRCIINIGSSEYNFTLNSDNFVSICSENGISEAVNELTVGEALHAMLTDAKEYTAKAEECIINNLENFELLTSDKIEELSDGRFLAIGKPGSSYVDGVKVNGWQIYELSNKKNTLTWKGEYKLSERTNKRNYSPVSPQTLKISFENDKITKSTDGGSSSYQCRKITNDILIHIVINGKTSSVSQILFRIDSPASKLDVEKIINDNLSTIDYQI